MGRSVIQRRLLIKLTEFGILLSLWAGVIYSAKVHAAPCCAGSNAVPALITGDEAQNFTLGLAHGKTVGDGQSPGVLPIFRDDLSPRESREVLTLNYSRLIDNDRWQAGFSIPLLYNHLENGGHESNSVDFGDVSITTGYELLPEYEYTLVVPRVFSFLQLTLPSGRSIYDSQNLLASDVGGLGEFQIALGSIAIKRWSAWDANAVAKVSRIFGRTFRSGSEAVSLGSSWGLTASLGAGFSFAERFRIGASLTPDYQSPLDARTEGIQSRNAQKLVWNTGLTATYLAGADDSWVLSYNDQTWFGPAINTALIRTFSLAFTHRIER